MKSVRFEGLRATLLIFNFFLSRFFSCCDYPDFAFVAQLNSTYRANYYLNCFAVRASRSKRNRAKEDAAKTTPNFFSTSIILPTK